MREKCANSGILWEVGFHVTFPSLYFSACLKCSIRVSFPGPSCGFLTLGLLGAGVLVLLVSLGVAIHLHRKLYPFGPPWELLLVLEVSLRSFLL